MTYEDVTLVRYTTNSVCKSGLNLSAKQRKLGPTQDIKAFLYLWSSTHENAGFELKLVKSTFFVKTLTCGHGDLKIPITSITTRRTSYCNSILPPTYYQILIISIQSQNQLYNQIITRQSIPTTMVNQDNRYQQGQPPPTGMTGQNSSEPLPILAPANPPPGASAPTGMSTVEGNHNDPQQQQQQLQHLQAQHQQNQGVATHLMGFMANPALAAAAAASPIFPPTGMLTNPGSFFAMPELFQQQHQNQPQQQHTAIAQSSGVPQGSSPVPPGGGATTMTSSQPNLNQQQFATPHPYPQHQQHPFSQMEILRQQQHLQFQMQHHSQPQQHPHQRQAGLNGGGGFPGQVPSSANPAGIQIPPSSSASLQAQLAAAQAAAEAVSMGQGEFSVTTGAMNGGGGRDSHSGSGSQQKKDLTPEQRVKQNRERNREHARSTRLRKKAYVQKLKELVEGLHAERSEEVRQRRVAIQHLSETQNVRRAVIHSFLKFHSSNETDKQKWSTILEDAFWLKQPVTPYRCFRRSEIEQVRQQKSKEAKAVWGYTCTYYALTYSQRRLLGGGTHRIQIEQ